jgi:hypothetical protein
MVFKVNMFLKTLKFLKDGEEEEPLLEIPINNFLYKTFENAFISS